MSCKASSNKEAAFDHEHNRQWPEGKCTAGATTLQAAVAGIK